MSFLQIVVFPQYSYSYSYLLGFFCCIFFSQVVKNLLSMSAKEIPKQNNLEKFEIREQSKNKTEAKWKYKVRVFQPERGSFQRGTRPWWVRGADAALSAVSLFPE